MVRRPYWELNKTSLGSSSGFSLMSSEAEEAYYRGWCQSANELRVKFANRPTCREAEPAMAGLRILARSGILVKVPGTANRLQKDCASIAAVSMARDLVVLAMVLE